MPQDPLFNQSLEKGLAVLKAFGTGRSTLSLAEIAERAEITKSSAQRMVHTLELLGYLAKEPGSRRMRLTPKVMELGYNYLAGDALLDVANPYLAELSRLSEETVNLTEPDGDSMVYVARFVAHRFIPIHMPIGSRIPMYCSGAGRAYLSALDHDTARALVERSPRPRHTEHTLVESREILERIELARRRGFSSQAEEIFLGDMSLAAAVVNSHGQPLAAVHIAAPTSRWRLEEAEARLAPLLIDCARNISGSFRGR
ncbi:IclR family transcriptional regulator [Halotalea alkalilenta]|uniref:IclR family transcriptional regulator n=1 Tax=Halotalea alkalilenta TaxID=376489 RepID=UPI0012DF8D1F|nr:IclR family transcriptional regulator [Halotalea alkalilenta]